MDEWDLSGALEAIWRLVRRLNAYVEETKPWDLAGDRSRAALLDRALFDLADGLRSIAVALSPFLPAATTTILAALGQPGDLAWDNVAPGKAIAAEGIGAAAPLFPRVDAPPAA
jgi:methionyl-tRNA synthetase